MEQVFRTSSLVLKRCKAELSIILCDSVASWQFFFCSQVNLTSIVLAEVCFNRINILGKKQSKFSYFHKYEEHVLFVSNQIYY
jgi:hypothetical protein